MSNSALALHALKQARMSAQPTGTVHITHTRLVRFTCTHTHTFSAGFFEGFVYDDAMRVYVRAVKKANCIPVCLRGPPQVEGEVQAGR